ncbi:HNH endonuclease [Mycobacterium phage GodPhather]|nr:HNH endonuclease [Mycobacterium phage GodPhather]
MPNGNARGNSRDRARRRAFLLSPEGGWGGDGETVPCWECGVLCGPDDVDLVCDRIIPGERGGSYFDPGNVAPHCTLCSHRQGQRRTVAITSQRRLAGAS